MSGARPNRATYSWEISCCTALDAVLARDFPTVQGVILLFSFVYVLVNLLVDLSYVYFDPRIRY